MIHFEFIKTEDRYKLGISKKPLMAVTLDQPDGSRKVINIYLSKSEARAAIVKLGLTPTYADASEGPDYLGATFWMEPNRK
jgi:hypothetical protein